jgi:hypothetical protein
MDFDVTVFKKFCVRFLNVKIIVHQPGRGTSKVRTLDRGRGVKKVF